MSLTIRQNFFYAHPVESVWEYLTDAGMLAQWLMPNDFQLTVGHDFQFRMKPIPQLELDGIFYCTVLEIDPLKKLSYTWKGGPGNGVIALDTVVVWTLAEKDNGTDLQVEHSGFKEVENLELYKGMTDGWRQNMQKIAQRLDSVPHDTIKP